MSALVCAACGCRIARENIAEASRPWRHVDLEGADSRAARSCSGATLIASSSIVRVDNDPASDGTWAAFIETNRDAGMSLEEIADIEEAIDEMGLYLGHNDCDVGLAMHLDTIAIEVSVAAAPIERVRDFVADFWTRGEPSEALDEDVRAFACNVIADGLADRSVTHAQIPHLFDAPRLVVEDELRDVPDAVFATVGRDDFDRLLSLANAARFGGEDGIADFVIARMRAREVHS